MFNPLTNNYEGNSSEEFDDISGNQSYDGHHILITGEREMDINIFNNNSLENTNETNEKGNTIELSEKMNNDSEKGPNKREKKIMGRKKNRGKLDENGNIIESGKHNEFANDNTIKKIKVFIRNGLQAFSNKKIVQKEGLRQGILNNILMKMNQKRIAKSNAENNKKFLSITVGELLSDDIKKGINLPKDHNKNIVQYLTKKYKDFEIFFSLTFLDCLKYFRGETIEKQEYLEGMKKYSQIKDDIIYKKGQEYADHLFKFLKSYEDIINNTKSRQRKNKKIE